MMNEQDVVNILKLLRNKDIAVWITGGWGVDALIGYQSRPHNDKECLMALRC
jgi:lincosamide nucleotidyltransferase A/C/D/E